MPIGREETLFWNADAERHLHYWELFPERNVNEERRNSQAEKFQWKTTAVNNGRSCDLDRRRIRGTPD